MITEQQILHYVSKQPKHMAGFKQLIHDLGLKGRDRRHLQQVLRELTRSRKLIAIGKERWGFPTTATNQDLVVGRLRMHRDGYGFVIPEPGSLPARAQGKLQGDIFIPPPEVGNAMHGDQVLVEMGRIRHDGKAEGRIVRVMEREQETVVGIFHYGDRQNYVRPIDEKIAQEIIIPPDMEYPSTEDEEGGPSEEDRDVRAPSVASFANTRGAQAPHGEAHEKHQEKKSGRSRSDHPITRSPDHPMGKAPTPKHPDRQSPHRVLGEEAQRKSWDDLEKVVVEVEITQWPSATQNPRGRVTEILGYEDDFGVDVEMIIRKHHIPHVFPAEVLEEAQEISPVIAEKEISHRRDYRDLPIVTIDGETARDFDDAVLVRKLENGNYELQVHIADVAHYVTDGSAIDAEARLRGTSVYFPDRAVPMLPLELSTDMCSLRPQVERLVLSCIMEIDHVGEIVGYELQEGVIRSAARMTYNEVQAILDGDASMRKQYAHLVSEFVRMEELAKILNRKREKRGSIDFDMPEPVIEFDEAGLMRGVTRSERKFSHRIIEEFMLAANECVAGYLESHDIASLYRIHEKPDAKKVYNFELLATAFGYSLGVSLPVRRFQTRGERRERHGRGRNPRQHEIPEEVHITPRMYQKLTQKIAGKPEERILSYLMLRSLKQARYSEENEGHFALAAPTYTHFTSPIRRYPDLIVHRILKAVLNDTIDGHGGPSGRDGQHGHHEQRGAGRPRPGVSHSSENVSPWSKRREKDEKERKYLTEIIPLDELHDIAVDSSMTERRADEAERELIEWKKIKFMQDKIGDEFPALIVSVTKYGLFVEIEDLFVEGLVPIGSLSDDRYTYRENTRQIIGDRSGHAYSIGDRVQVILDRIDRVQRKLQFAIVEEQRKTERRTRRSRR